MEIKRNELVKTTFLQTRGKEHYKINLQTTLAVILIRYSITIILPSKYP
jgi:hypothetical protein